MLPISQKSRSLFTTRGEERENKNQSAAVEEFPEKWPSSDRGKKWLFGVWRLVGRYVCWLRGGSFPCWFSGSAGSWQRYMFHPVICVGITAAAEEEQLFSLLRDVTY